MGDISPTEEKEGEIFLLQKGRRGRYFSYRREGVGYISPTEGKEWEIFLLRREGVGYISSTEGKEHGWELAHWLIAHSLILLISNERL